jgi:hypothetical protein
MDVTDDSAIHVLDDDVLSMVFSFAGLEMRFSLSCGERRFFFLSRSRDFRVILKDLSQWTGGSIHSSEPCVCQMPFTES